MRTLLRRTLTVLLIAAAVAVKIVITLVTTLIILVVVPLGPTHHPDTSALGPAVETIPDEAATALLVSQVEDYASKSSSWRGDSAWLVFLDGDGRLLGHRGAAAMMQNRLARTGDTIALAQPESFLIMSRTSPPTTLPHPRDYAVSTASSTYSPTREAFLWTGYGPTAGLRIGADGGTQRLTRRGDIVAAGYCGDDYYLAAGTTAATSGAPSRITLERAAPGRPFEPIASWIGRSPHDSGVPITCTGSTIRVPLNDDCPGPTAASDSASSGVTGFREVDAATGESRWLPAATPVIDWALSDRMAGAPGSAISWHSGPDSAIGTATTYVDRSGALARLVPGVSTPDAAGMLGRADSVYLMAVTVGDGTRAVLAMQDESASGHIVRDSTTLITYDLTTGAELARLSPDFLKGKALGPAGVNVSDIVLLR